MYVEAWSLQVSAQLYCEYTPQTYTHFNTHALYIKIQLTTVTMLVI